jgi:hypothetical protein
MPTAEAHALLDRDEERALHGVLGVGAVAAQPQRDSWRGGVETLPSALGSAVRQNVAKSRSGDRFIGRQ